MGVRGRRTSRRSCNKEPLVFENVALSQRSYNDESTLHVWRQAMRRDAAGQDGRYEARDISPDMSFLEMLDVVNERLDREGRGRRSRSITIVAKAFADRAA